MTVKWQVDPCTETYLDMAIQIKGMVHSFRKKYRIDEDEAYSAARLGFVLAYNTYDPEKVESFDKWVSTKVWSVLFASLRRQYRDSRRPLETTGDDPMSYLDSFPDDEPPGFNLQDFLHELTDDAKHVVVMVFNPPKKVQKTVKAFGEDNEINLRMAVKQFLTDAKWSANRIRKAFREVRNAL